MSVTYIGVKIVNSITSGTLKNRNELKKKRYIMPSCTAPIAIIFNFKL
jgi:hypothetical protein